MFTFLPQGYKEEVMRDYRVRAVSVFLALCIVAAVFAIVLMAPTFVSLYFQRQSALNEKLEAEQRETQSADASAAADVARINAHLNVISKNADEQTIVSIFEKVLAKERDGISIMSLAIDRNEKDGVIQIGGVASTRDALVMFSRSLEGEPSFASVDLPVSSLAKNQNISFSISVVLKPKP